MASDDVLQGSADELRHRILTDRFEVIDAPLGWRCRSCSAEVEAAEGEAPSAAMARLSESAADHATFCGRCSD